MCVCVCVCDMIAFPLLSLFTDILRKFDHMTEVIVPKLPTSFDYVTDPEGRAALLWILGEYGEVSVWECGEVGVWGGGGVGALSVGVLTV